MDNTILILIKIITALYFNDKSEDKNNQIYEEIEIMLSEIKLDLRAGVGIGTEESAIESLRFTAEWMVYNKEGGYNRADILQRLSVNLQGNNEYILIAKEAIDENITAIDARARVVSIMQELRYNKTRVKLKTTILRANAKLNFSGDYIEVGHFVNELMSELTEVHSKSVTTNSGLVGKVDFTNDESIEAALTKGVELADETGKLNTGFQGLNKACGGFGPPRGALVNFGGLTHHYKSGILKDMLLNLPVYNDPWMWDNTKKPMIFGISFENTIDQDIKILYQKLYECKFNLPCDIAKIDIKEATLFVKEHFQQRGYTVHMEHYDPNNFSIYDLFDILNKLIDAGYEIHATICDYLGQIAHNTFGDRVDSKIQKTFEMVRNFCYPKGITFFTAHQLSTAAQKLAAENSAGFTKKVNSGGWYMDCQSLHTKLDIEFVLHKHKHIDGEAYLMFGRGKDRFNNNTPESHQHFMMKFEPIGGIRPDVYTASSALYALPKVIDSATDENVWGD